MKFMKKFFGKSKALAVAAVSALGFGLSARAEGSASTIDTTVAVQALSDMVDAVKTYVNSSTTIIVGLLGTVLVITLLWVGYRLVSKGSKKVS